VLAAACSHAQQPRFDAYFAGPPVSTTVSPYLHLGVDANGISNYQTFVRPLAEQRSAMERRAAAQHREGSGRTARGRGGAEDGQMHGANIHGIRPTGRFMNLSHYFGRGGIASAPQDAASRARR
jgi:hypothetical protein